MENTTNYGLRKYQSGTLFNPLTVNNPNLDDIDADMKAISDRAIGRATELVSQGVHAITLLDTDCKTFKFVATGNYSAGETFTVNGIQANAYTPGGSALTSNAFVTGSIVLGTLNEDGTAITFYVTGSAVADDSLKLGGQLPSYYATQSDMTDAENNIDNLNNKVGNNSIVGIGDGTCTGAIATLNNNMSSLRTSELINAEITATGNHTLNEDIDNFKFILVVGSRVGSIGCSTMLIPVSTLKAGNEMYQTATDANADYYIKYKYVNDTTINITSVGSYKIISIIGINI